MGKESEMESMSSILINKWNGVTVRCYYGERMAQVGNRQMVHGFHTVTKTKLIKELEA